MTRGCTTMLSNASLCRIWLVLLLATLSTDALARKSGACGNLFVVHEGTFATAEARPRYFSKLSLSNGLCKPVGFVAERGENGLFWFGENDNSRVEFRHVDSDRWTSYESSFSRGPPRSRELTVLLKPGEKSAIYVEINASFVAVADCSKRYRVFVTDSQGVSRSSQEFVFHCGSVRPNQIIELNPSEIRLGTKGK